MFVVLDSNIWISQRGLKAPQAIEALKFIKTRNSTLVIPEVVRLEVETKLRGELLTHRKQIGDSTRYIATVLADLDEMSLPTCDEIDQRVLSLVKDTGVPTREIPLTLAAAQSSFHKILHKLQPSDKAQQFTDGVIWENCIELLAESEVCLVTKDKAFYKDYDYHHGIAPNLEDESKKCSHQLRLFADLDRLLQDARQDVQRVWSTDDPAYTPSRDSNHNSDDEKD